MLFKLISPLTGLLFLATNVASVPSQPRSGVAVQTHVANDKSLNFEVSLKYITDIYRCD